MLCLASSLSPSFLSLRPVICCSWDLEPQSENYGNGSHPSVNWISSEVTLLVFVAAKLILGCCSNLLFKSLPSVWTNPRPLTHSSCLKRSLNLLLFRSLSTCRWCDQDRGSILLTVLFRECGDVCYVTSCNWCVPGVYLVYLSHLTHPWCSWCSWLWSKKCSLEKVKSEVKWCRIQFGDRWTFFIFLMHFLYVIFIMSIW